MADYTPSVSPYSVPDLTDPPDVPTHMRNYAARMTSHGFRTRWNQAVYAEGASTGGVVLAPGFKGTHAAVANPISKSTYAPRCEAFIYGFAVVGVVGNAAGYVGITDNIAGGSWLTKHRWHTNGDNPDTLFVLSSFAIDYFDPDATPGWSLRFEVDAGGNSLVVREGQVNAQVVPINQ